ncbi:MAG: alpha,alpha-trehalase TreA [Ginsengibacter sp.]
MEIKNIFSLGELFEKIQTGEIFPDSKTFVDCTPNSDFSSIHDCYINEKDKEGFSLTDFVNKHFILPTTFSENYVPLKNRTIIQHIEGLWDVLTRETKESNNSLIPLPHSYVVPGGRFREMFYWDSYFTMLGLIISRRIDLIQNMVDNFAYLIDQYGYIPNGNRTYFLGRSQPPFFALMIQLLSEEKGDNVLLKYLPQLEKEYSFWMKGIDQVSTNIPSVFRVALMPDKNILNHYWDESDAPRPEAYRQELALAKDTEEKNKLYRNLRAAAESGWDFSSRWFKNKLEFSSIHTTEIIPVDLNCLLLNLEQTISKAYLLADNKDLSKTFEIHAAKRSAAINTYCWNEENKFYFDYDYVENKNTDSLNLAAVFPLFFKIASDKQAADVAKKLKEKFLSAGGLVTTTETTDQQWDAPNGWAPLQWMSVKSLANYEFLDLAAEIASRWMELNKKVYESTGKMMEKYNVVDANLIAGGGEYPAQDGFGWTNGVYLALSKWMSQNK